MRYKLLCLLLALLLSAGCAARPQEESSAAPEGDDRLRISATLFPQYDFARAVAGEHAEVTLLLPPGVESHSFEPTPADVILIGESDLFLYTGPEMEPWAQKLAQNNAVSAAVVDLSQGIEPVEARHGYGEGHTHHHEHESDPHIWTSPVNAMAMTQTIADALCEADPANEKDYRENAARYLEELSALDAALRELTENAAHSELYFGGRFAFAHLAAEYHLEVTAAFDSCSSETEPSARAVTAMIDGMREKGIGVVYYEELAEPKTARLIAGETGAEMLLLHSCHNLSKEEFEAGETYLSLMTQNIENLRKGLN